MSRKLVALLVVFSFILTGAAFAAVENIKVSGDIGTTAVNRDLSLGMVQPGMGTADAEEFIFSQVRLRFDADLTEGVSAVIGLLNERVWGRENGFWDEDQVSLDLAYVELREFLYQPLTIRVGRQPLRYGNGLIVGDPDTNQGSGRLGAVALSDALFGDLSLRKSFDSIRAILDYAPYTIDIVYAKLQEMTTNINDDRNLVGINVNYEWASYNGVTEGYIWHYRNNAVSLAGTPIVVPWPTQPLEDQAKTWIIGSRFQYDPNDNWTLGLEGAYQFGDIAITVWPNTYQHLSAFAAQGSAEYRFLNDYNAKLGLSYTYLSGDDDVTDGAHTAWQPIAEDQTPGEIINMLLPSSGAQVISVSGSMMPREDITTGIAYYYVGLTEKINYDGVVTALTPRYGPIAALGNGYNIEGNKTDFGSEIDTFFLYDYTEDVQIKLTSAYFIPGGFFHSENNDIAYSFKAGLSVDF